jgi:hypothetical protein
LQNFCFCDAIGTFQTGVVQSESLLVLTRGPLFKVNHNLTVSTSLHWLFTLDTTGTWPQATIGLVSYWSMKRILFLIFGLTYVVGAFGQGTIYFANNPQFPVYTNNAIGNYGNAPQNKFHVALYWGTVGSTEAQLVQIGPAVGGVADGIFNGGVYTTPNGTAPGANAVFEVKGWTGNFATYEAALAAAQYDSSIQVDTSGAWVNPTGPNAGNPAPMIFGPEGFNCLFLTSLTTVPEPSTIVLAGAGGIMMVVTIKRRKK